MKHIRPISVTLPYRNISELDSLCNDMGFLIMDEIWKDVIGYEGLYQVSNLGKVKSLSRSVFRNGFLMRIKERILKPGINSCGYYGISLNKNGVSEMRSIHRVVAESFLNHTPNGMVIIIDHINNDKLDNRSVNLQLTNNRYNCSKDKSINKSSKYCGVHFHKSTDKWLAQIRINRFRKYLGIFDNELDASKAYQNELNKINN